MDFMMLRCIHKAFTAFLNKASSDTSPPFSCLWVQFHSKRDMEPLTFLYQIYVPILLELASLSGCGGSAHGSHDVKGFTFENSSILLNNDINNNISVLSVMVGLPDSGAYLESRFAGLTNVEIRCSDGFSYNLTNHDSGYQVGMLGEKLQIYNEQNLSNVDWIKATISTNQPLTWYKAMFDVVVGDELPLALNLSSMGKGEAWVNGQSIGRYWISFHTSKGAPSQTLYHVPRSFLKPSGGGNLLVLFEEIGGDPLGISLNTISVDPPIPGPGPGPVPVQEEMHHHRQNFMLLMEL